MRLTVASAAGFVHRGRAAETLPQKVSKEVAKYQDHPNNMQMCVMCKFFISSVQSRGGMMGGRVGSGMMGQGGMMGGGQMRPGMMAAGTCQVVEGSISPMGWCALYQPTNASSTLR